MRRHVSTRPRKSARFASLICLETLESRQLMAVDLLSTSPSIAIDLPVAHVGVISRPAAEPLAAGSSVAPYAGTAVSGPYTPAQIRHAYGFDQLALDGAGQTIAIVDAYDSPNIASDLKAFNARFGLPDAPFTKVTPPGQAAPAYDGGWATEIALDVQWAHAIAPKASIVLIETVDASLSALMAGVDYAVQIGAKAVSMSWGANEFSGVSTLDPHFNKPGVTFLASSGDSGIEVNFPAVSPYVTSVGGTTMPLDASGNRISETAWGGSGGGISTQVNKPSFQNGFVSGTRRGGPDVSYDADPNTGFYVLLNGYWSAVGGTSAGAPQWAGMIALVNQGRAAAGLDSLGTGQAFGTNSVLYSLAGGTSYTNPKGDFLDITGGSNGTPATVGWDTATGLGSPVATKIVPDLIGLPALPPPTSTTPTIADAGFETSAVADGAFQQGPAGTAWTFSGNAWLAANDSGFTAQNPVAPQGRLVGVLQMANSMISQTVSGWSAGTYALSFQAAQRQFGAAQRQDFQVLVDGQVVATARPDSGSYQLFTTTAFTVSAGPHTIAFKGLDSVGGDNSAFIDDVRVIAATAPPPPPPPPPPTSTTPTIADAGFETSAVADGAFQQGPAGTAWTFSGNAWLAANDSGFTAQNPVAPQGRLVGVLQMANSMISQTVSGWSAGTYALSFQAAQRQFGAAQRQDFQVLVDGQVVATARPDSGSYQLFTTTAFTVSAGPHTIAFKGLDSVGGDHSAFIDDVRVIAATAPPPPPPTSTTPTIADAGFETSAVADGAFQQGPAGTAWTFSGNAWLAANDSGFTAQNPVAPQGRLVGVLQMANSMISQTVSGWSAGTYALSFQAAQRQFGAAQRQDFQVLVDGQVVATARPDSGSYQLFTTTAFTVSAGPHTIAFKGLDSVGGDNSAFIDDVRVITA